MSGRLSETSTLECRGTMCLGCPKRYVSTVHPLCRFSVLHPSPPPYLSPWPRTEKEWQADPARTGPHFLPQ
eukprot:6559082-Pyramimonas_sp.AAC.1